LGSERDFACGFGHPANVRSISEIVAGQCGSFWPRSRRARDSFWPEAPTMLSAPVRGTVGGTAGRVDGV
jgi:hypothetical protein